MIELGRSSSSPEHQQSNLLNSCLEPRHFEPSQRLGAELDTTKKKEDQDISKMNLKAYSNLLSSIDTSTTEGHEAFDIAECSTDNTDYPYGNVKEAWDNLKVE